MLIEGEDRVRSSSRPPLWGCAWTRATLPPTAQQLYLALTLSVLVATASFIEEYWFLIVLIMSQFVSHHDVSLELLAHTLLLWFLMSHDVFVLLLVFIHSGIKHNVWLRPSVPGGAIDNDSKLDSISTTCSDTMASQLECSPMQVTRSATTSISLGRILFFGLVIPSKIMWKKVTQAIGSICLAAVLHLWKTLSGFQLHSASESDVFFRLKVSKRLEPDWLRKDALLRSAANIPGTRIPNRLSAEAIREVQMYKTFGSTFKRGVIKNTVAIPVQQLSIRLWKDEKERSAKDRFPVKMRPQSTGSPLAREVALDKQVYQPSMNNFLAQGWVKGVDIQSEEEMGSRGRDRGRNRAIGRRSFDSSPQARSCLAAGLGLSSRRLGQACVPSTAEEDYTPPLPTLSQSIDHHRSNGFPYIPPPLSIPLPTPLLIAASVS